MRKINLFGTMAGLLTILVGLRHTALADGPPPAPAMSGQYGAYVPPGPAAGNVPYTPVAPGPGPGKPGGFSPDVHPWPKMSPFAAAYQKHENDSGLWFRDVRPFGKKYRVDVSALRAEFRTPAGTPIGALSDFTSTFSSQPVQPVAGLLPDFQTDIDGFNTIGDPGGVRFVGMASLGSPLQVSPFLTLFTGGPTGQPSLLPQSTDVGVSIDTFTGAAPTGAGFKGITGRIFDDDSTFLFDGNDFFAGQDRDLPGSTGFQFEFEVEQEDETSVEVSGWFVGDSPLSFERGLLGGVDLYTVFDDPTNSTTRSTTIPNRQQDADITNNLRVAGIVLLDNPFPNDPTGTPLYTVLPYDMYFRVEHTTEVGGTDVKYHMQPIYKSTGVRLRPYAGLKYAHLREGFEMFGASSGLNVDYDLNGLPTAVTLQPTLDFTGDGVPDSVLPFDSQMNAEVTSNLFGPTAGIDFLFGSDDVSVAGDLAFGLLGNWEQTKISGDGFGTAEATSGGIQSFSSSERNAHISPSFEASVHGQAKLFKYVPYINRYKFFSEARFRTGITFLNVWEVARPLEQIVWTSSDAVDPYIGAADRDNWYLHYWDFGVSWTF
ncbi:hypothetical protein [Stratiformator vulcanicus]|uniref:Uncharacterized protein n=1 Tax=Stratiformator vulcanicus TaxID=2527980 RepID=A0A517QZH3_9PLAN|nr:hypothetical protein [Stratiformator vulcanicus]QDT37047.1 hypothetical protein Pan189_14130 [Stratiformator vulcanicus]